ncbi:B3 domain-containing protein Os01g0723500-like [Actinidia eriantha]|uniref:B3 domain-containing protein Os01g0723500-like n=1 Tax=Actinidia eriantha TaxID=165200 RepID=UPI00258D3CFD|nr:B3 domain-containing protein Os01g0723500-like [Actinidia eriantha]
MLNAKRPHFFEGFDPASSSERLIIPSKFMKYLEGKASGTVSLVGPSGNTWHVELIQHNGNLFFHDGWPAFVQDHAIERGDALVFRYDGDLHFTVQVFDQSLCEKEAAFSAECTQDHGNSGKLLGWKRERVYGASSLDDIVQGVPKKARGSHAYSGCMINHQEEGWRPDEVVSVSETCQTAIYAHETRNCCSPSMDAFSFALPLQLKVPDDNSGAIIENRNGKESELGSSAGDGRLMLSASEAEGLARTFTSSYPNFIKTMKRFNVSGSYTLNIPYQFSMAHLPKCKVRIVLRNLKGGSWTVNSIPTMKVNISHTLCGGWMAFVRDNNINMGDVCIFELVGKCELRVYILRVGKEGLECQNGEAAVNGIGNGFGAASHKNSERLPKKKRSNARNVHLQLITKGGKNKEAGGNRDKANGGPSKNSAFSSLVKACDGKLGISNKIILEEKSNSYTKICMSMKSAPEEKMAAQSFVSSFPHFVRVMKKFNISGSFTLKIPYQFSMAHLPDFKTEIVLHNLRGQCWTVNSIPSTRVQTLHTFCGGWMAFVRDNDIQMGDICIFELIGQCEMRVHISGVGKNGLDYHSGKVASNELTLATSVGNRPLL